MNRVVISAIVALGLAGTVASAQAGEWHRHKHHGDHHARMMWNAPVSMYQNRGPRWSQPNECYVDLGYGRFESCDR
jgi:hypothetical protein